MRRGIIALILLIAAGVAAGIQYVFVTTNTNMFVEMLTQADQSVEENDFITAHDIASRLDHRYEDIVGTLNIFIHHGDTGSISGSLARLRRYAQTGDASSFLAESAAAKRALLSLYNAEIPCAQNVM